MVEQSTLKRISETAYLNQENTWRYRSIIHFCYKKHERMQTYIYPEEIYQYLREDDHFKEYTSEQLNQDLNQLVQWHNLSAQQETANMNTIDDFKKKKLRYQCTPYTVEIERMIQNLQKIGSEFGGSLEITQFDRLLHSITMLLDKGNDLSAENLNQTWNDLCHYFKTMVQNAADYLAHVKSEKVEERMKTSEFIIYKDKFTHYLQNFMIGLQHSSLQIEAVFKRNDAVKEKNIIDKIANYQLNYRLGEEKSAKEYFEEYMEQYLAIKEWFLGAQYRESELRVLYGETMETIRRITRFAKRLAERHQAFRSRKNDYIYLSRWFLRLGTQQEAAKLSAVLFGTVQMRHFYAKPRSSDSFDILMQEEAPTVIEMKPRTKTYREKSKQQAMTEYAAEKRLVLQKYREQQIVHDELIDKLIHHDSIDLAELPKISTAVRKTLLGWITRCLQQETRQIQTQTGRQVKLLWDNNTIETIVLKSDDGEFVLPKMKLQVTAARMKNYG
ncbi:TIGR02677 family protein [Pectinatus sottacetonis]|uniref:TIGR02677 family protein n=1 Tax=Pectinatus sottacetonis TaxID=1002795 RepID=UPI0018C709B0|nr:TIGR02677 family protein [Pectinatus sottacetonis]